MTHKETTLEIIIRGTVNTHGKQHILVIPTSNIVLRIEEIPPLDVFYSPQHKAIFKRQRKKRKLESTIATTPDNKPMDVLWKDSLIDPSSNLTRLSQFTSAYVTKTIDKATDVQLLLKEKEDKILSLEHQLQQAKTSQQAEIQLAKLQRELQQMKIEHQGSLGDKEA